MKSKLFSLLIVASAVIALIATSGCCRKPPEEVGLAQAAVAQAKENCAEVYAPEEYKQAYDAMSMAESYAEDRKCKDAERSALEAIQLAADAETRANEKKAFLDAKVQGMIAEFEKRHQEGQAKYAALQQKKAEMDRKAASAQQVAREREFEKYQIQMELPEVQIDPTIERDGEAVIAQFEKAKRMYAEGGCNLFEVIAELEKIPPMVEPIFKKIEENMRAFEEMDAVVEHTLQTKLVEVEEAMKPKYMTEHTVVKGECLWKIAEYELVYNDPFRWPLLWWENQWTEEKAMNLSKDDRFNLIKDPDLIYPDQKLKIKQEVAADEVEQAIKYAKNRYGTTDWRDIPDFLTDGK